MDGEASATADGCSFFPLPRSVATVRFWGSVTGAKSKRYGLFTDDGSRASHPCSPWLRRSHFRVQGGHLVAMSCLIPPAPEVCWLRMILFVHIAISPSHIPLHFDTFSPCYTLTLFHYF